MGWFDRLRDALADWVASRLATSALPAGTIPARVPAVDLDPLQEVQYARVYYDGRQDMAVTKRQREWLDRHSRAYQRYQVNACATTVNAYTERLLLRSVGVLSEDEARAEEAEQVLARHIIPPAVQKELYRAALVDGVAFLHVDYTAGPEDTTEPGWASYRVKRLLVPEQYGGSGEGIVPLYGGGDWPMGYEEYWYETLPDPRTGEEVTARRRVRYLTGLIVHEVRWPSGEDWEPYPDEENTVVLWQAGAETGEAQGENVLPADDPLPPPIVPFFAPDGRSVLGNVMPLQAALDKVWLNMLMASDWLGAGLIVFTGWIPTSDGKPLAADRSNLLQPVPGDYLYTLASDASVQALRPTSVSELLDLEARLMARLAMVTGLPVSMFISSRQVASDATLKQQEASLIARLREFQAKFQRSMGAWAEVLLSQVVAFGHETTLDTWTGFRYEPRWESVEMRDENEAVQRAVEKVRKLGVDLAHVWQEELGYPPDLVDALLESPFAQALIAQAKAQAAMAEADRYMGAG